MSIFQPPARVSLILPDLSALASSTPFLSAVFWALRPAVFPPSPSALPSPPLPACLLSPPLPCSLRLLPLPLPTCNRPALPCRCCLFFLFVCLRFLFLAVHCVLQGSAPALCCCFFARPSFFVPPLGFPWFCLTSRPLPLRTRHFLLLVFLLAPCLRSPAAPASPPPPPPPLYLQDFPNAASGPTYTLPLPLTLPWPPPPLPLLPHPPPASRPPLSVPSSPREPRRAA